MARTAVFEASERKGQKGTHRLFLHSISAIELKAGLGYNERGVKIGGRNFSNLNYAADTVLLAESSNELGKVKEGNAKAGMQVNAKKTKS